MLAVWHKSSCNRLTLGRSLSHLPKARSTFLKSGGQGGNQSADLLELSEEEIAEGGARGKVILWVTGEKKMHQKERDPVAYF